MFWLLVLQIKFSNLFFVQCSQLYRNEDRNNYQHNIFTPFFISCVIY